MVLMPTPKVSIIELDWIKEKLIYYLDGKALLNASYKGYQEIVKYLAEHGADINAQGMYIWD